MFPEKLDPEDWEAIIEDLTVAKGGSGSKKKKKRDGLKGSNSVQNIVSTQIENSKRKRNNQELKNPNKSIGVNPSIDVTVRRIINSPDNDEKTLDSYISWLLDKLNKFGTNDPTFNIESECEITLYKSGGGPGGQNKNKVETSVRLKHKFMKVLVKRTKRPSQSENKENAVKEMENILNTHITLWANYVTASPYSTKETILKKIEEVKLLTDL